MTRIIAITNQKGGVGKTTTAINLAAALAACDVRVLLIDSDSQGNSTSGLGIEKTPDLITLYDVELRDRNIREAIRTTTVEGLDILPPIKTSSASTLNSLAGKAAKPSCAVTSMQLKKITPLSSSIARPPSTF